MPDYDTTFFNYVNSGALRSAGRVLPLLMQAIPIREVLDVGCGAGAWLSVWRRLGAAVVGIDGQYVDRAQLLIPQSSFIAHDLTEPFELHRRFDLVQSLEVAEHLPEERSTGFVADLVLHGDLVLFSAAAKGQGGDHHINEQSYDYWRDRFARHGYIALDYLRPQLLGARDVEPWYRYNMVLYACSERLQRLPSSVRCSRIPSEQKIPDVSPVWYQARKTVMRFLPVRMATSIAKVKERWVVSRRGV